MRLVVVALAMLVLVAACGVGAPPPLSPDQRSRVIEPGRGVFTFDGYAPLRERPVRVWYDAPAEPSTAEILIVMHGVARDGQDYRADWEELVAGRNVLVLVPEFSDEHYPGAEAYNLGNVRRDDGSLRPRSEWSFHVVEALFDHVVRELGSPARDYALFGHSAGAQFVHRFVLLVPTHRARTAVAANAGWYTVPDDSVAFPYGLGEGPATERGMERAFASDLVVLLGGDDVDSEDEYLRRDPESDAQGLNRLDRGQFFYRVSRDVAARESFPFRWRLTTLPDISHSHREMAAAAAPLLLDPA